jgi:hypothetical protein
LVQLDAPVAYRSGLRAFTNAVCARNPTGALNSAPFVVLPAALVVAVVVLATTRTAPGPTGRMLVIAICCGVSATLLYPRADHVVFVMPPALVLLVSATAHAAAATRAGWSWFVRGALALSLVVAGVAVLVVVDRDWDATRSLDVVSTPHFRGALTDSRTWDEIVRETAALRSDVGPDGRVFIVSQKAGLYYLVGRLTNPTPYDYPDRTEFGDDGLEDVRRGLGDGTITYSCIDRHYPAGLAPQAVIGLLRQHSHLVATFHICELWLADRQAPEAFDRVWAHRA